MFRWIRNSFANTSVFYLYVGIFSNFLSIYHDNKNFFFLSIFLTIASILKTKSFLQILVVLFLSILSGLYLNTFTTSIKLIEDFKINESVNISGLIKEVEGKRAELIFVKINNKRIINRVFIEVDETNTKKLDSIKAVADESDFEKYYKKDLIIRDISNNIEIKNNIFSKIIDSTSKRLKQTTQEYFNEKSPLINAMVFGVKDDLDKDDKKVFKDLGISHILVASGANILMVMTTIEIISNKLNLKYKKTLGFVVVSFYLMLVGFEGSITRAFFFFIINLISSLIGREVDYLQKIALTTLFLCLIFPTLVFGISFYLSLAATLSIKISEDFCDFLSIKSEILINLITNIFIITIVNFLTSYFFSSINLAGLATNLIILTFVEYIVIYGFVLISSKILFSYFSITILNRIFDIVSTPLDLLLNIFTKIVDYIYLFFSDKWDFKIHIDLKLLTLTYLTLITFWIYIIYKRYVDTLKRLYY